MNIFLVMIGGALGAVIRHSLSTHFSSQLLFIQNPGVLLANGIGCFLLAIFNISSYASGNMKYLVSIGFLGALTTFSSFIAEAFLVSQRNNFLLSITFIFIHIVIGSLTYNLGLYIGKTITYG